MLYGVFPVEQFYARLARVPAAAGAKRQLHKDAADAQGEEGKP